MDDDSHHEGGTEGRVTSPMQEYTIGQVARGAIVLVVGLALTFGVGFVL